MGNNSKPAKILALIYLCLALRFVSVTRRIASVSAISESDQAAVGIHDDGTATYTDNPNSVASNAQEARMVTSEAEAAGVSISATHATRRLSGLSAVPMT